MLNVAVLAANPMAGDAIEQMAQDSSVIKIVFRNSPISSAIPVITRGLRICDPDVVLMEIGDWESVVPVVRNIKESNLRAVLIGFRPAFNKLEQATFEEAGVQYLLREPFSPAEMQEAAYGALHKERPVTNRNILAFLPAKAGGGCSTVAMHTAIAVASGLSKSTLLMECDRRSAVYAIMLNLDNRQGLDSALRLGTAMTPGEWHQHFVNICGLHLLPASPRLDGSYPTWVDYYHLLKFVEGRYEYLFADLPEVTNDATAEVVRSARCVFIVCTPEVASLKMARLRAKELDAGGIAPDRIHIIANRSERNGPAPHEIEKILERPVFGQVPNDYGHLKAAMLASRPVDSESPFFDGCRGLARKIAGLPVAPQDGFTMEWLRKLGIGRQKDQ